MLPVEKPDLSILWPDVDDKQITFLRYGASLDRQLTPAIRQYEMDFVPSGFLSRMLIRVAQLTRINSYWRYGTRYHRAYPHTAYSKHSTTHTHSTLTH